jgi:hypothetical protein
MTRSFGFLAVAGWCLSTAAVLDAQKALDRPTAMQLLKDRVAENVTGMISAYPDSQNPERAAAYRELEKAGVLSCGTKDSAGKTVCVPGENASDLSSPGPGLLAIVAGDLVPTQVYAIEPTSETSAETDFRLSQRPTAVYQKHKANFDRISVDRPPLAEHAADKIARGYLKLYGDFVWRYTGMDHVREASAPRAAPK